jgi:hypothetical protein
MTRRTVAVLTRHFTSAIVAPPLLTDLGVDFLRRTAASILAILLVAGIFLTRAFFKKYVYLYAAWDQAAYFRAVDADTLLMIAVPMLVTGVVAITLSPLLFPDELDYRALSPLPITRLELFAAKLLAVGLVAIVTVVALNSIASLWFPVGVGGRWMTHSLGARVAAHAAASLAASMWMFTAVMALQGICLVALPSRWRRTIGAALLGALFVGLLLSVPYVLRIPTLDITARNATEHPLVWVPPVWFLGVERLLLTGQQDGYAAVAAIAGWATLTTTTVIAITYAVLFRNAESLAFDAASRRRPAAPVAPVPPVALRLPQPTRGVLVFTVRGLTRSRLHSIVFLFVAGIALAILIGQVMTVVYGATFLGYGPRVTEHAVIAAPLVLALGVGLALRAAFLLPLDREASWLFRITETPPTRALGLDAVARVFVLAAVVPSVVLAALLQPYFLGGRWFICTALAAGTNLLLVEILLRNWARIPFTCTYLPGKRVLAYNLGALLATYFVFVYMGAHLIRWIAMDPGRTIVFGGGLTAACLALRRARLQTWGTQPLEFEDEDPLAIRTLNLLPDERSH